MLDTEQDVKDRMKELGLKYDPESTGQYDPESGNIIMNRKASIDLSEGRTAGHELMHKVLFNTLYKVGEDGTIEGKNVVQGLTNVLDEYLQDLEIDNLKLQDGSDINMLTDERSIYQRKLALYKESPETMRAEEKFTLFRDALANGDIQFNENFVTKIGDVVRRLLNSVGMRDIKFNDGRDVYNFIKDFNYDFEKGKLSKSIDKLRTKGAEVGENIVDTLNEQHRLLCQAAAPAAGVLHSSQQSFLFVTSGFLRLQQVIDLSADTLRSRGPGGC